MGGLYLMIAEVFHARLTYISPLLLLDLCILSRSFVALLGPCVTYLVSPVIVIVWSMLISRATLFSSLVHTRYHQVGVPVLCNVSPVVVLVSVLLSRATVLSSPVHMRCLQMGTSKICNGMLGKQVW